MVRYEGAPCDGCRRFTAREVVRVGREIDVGLEAALSVEVLTFACAECGLLSGADVDAAAELAGARAVILAGIANGRTFSLLRRTLGLRTRELGRLLSAGVGTISRWENARREIDPKAWVLLAALVLEARGEPSVGARELLERVARPGALRPARALALPGSVA